MLTVEQIKNVLRFREQYQDVPFPEVSESLKRIVASNMESLMGYSDKALLILTNNERIGLDPIKGAKNPDPVYRKLSRASKLIHTDRQYWTLEPMLDKYANNLQIAMEHRTMTQEQYKHIHDAPIRELIGEWSDDIWNKLKAA